MTLRRKCYARGVLKYVPKLHIQNFIFLLNLFWTPINFCLFLIGATQILFPDLCWIFVLKWLGNRLSPPQDQCPPAAACAGRCQYLIWAKPGPTAPSSIMRKATPMPAAVSVKPSFMSLMALAPV